MNNIISVAASSKCTGCGCCANICAFDAIQMKADEDGFYRPVINEDSCKDCGLCLDRCPANAPDYSNDPEPECYALMASDEVRAKSSSGGAFTLIADEIFRLGGYVCGVAYMDDCRKTHHIIIDDPEDMAALRGSKYIMSNTEDVYKRIGKLLSEEKYVLFSGTPCQVAGLNAYLGSGKDSPYLLTVDLICHGIPSEKAFSKYMRDLHSNRKIQHLGFKDKEYGWHASLTIKYDNDEIYNMPCETDPYFISYLNGLNKNKSCGECQFAKMPRQGDITIGDYWGINNYNPDFNDKKGTSVVLINNERAKRFIAGIKENAKLFEPTPLDPAIKGNSNLVKSPRNHTSRSQFFKKIDDLRYQEAVKWGFAAERYDIGLVGIPTFPNFGGALTYYSLYSTLKDMGYSVALFSRPRSTGRPPIPPEHIYTKNPYAPGALKLDFKDKEAMRMANDICENFVVGSDQLFNSDLYKRFGEIVTLDWISDNHRKVAYAASFGHNFFWGPEKERAKMAHFMQKFDAFSVREEDGVKLAKESFGVDAQHVLDPVFLCDRRHYERIAEDSGIKSSDKHIFSYILDPTEAKESILSHVEEKLGLESELYSDMLYLPSEAKIKVESAKFRHTLLQGNVNERLNSLVNSDFIVTDSFHGVCFAIIFEIPFVAILNPLRGASRFYSVLGKLGLLDRLVSDVSELEEKKWLLEEPMDFTGAREILAAERERCLDWLKNAIEPAEKCGKAFSDVDIMNDKFAALKKELVSRDIRINAMLSNRNFMYESDFNKYLDALISAKEELDIYITVMDTPGLAIKDELANKLMSLGIKTSLKDKHWRSYVAALDGGKLVNETLSKKDERVIFTGNIGGRSVKVVSASFNKGNYCAVVLDGVDYSNGRRGLNFVVADKATGMVVDTVNFDTHIAEYTCWRFGQQCTTHAPEIKAVAAVEAPVQNNIYSDCTDIHWYLDLLCHYKDNLNIFIAVKDTPGLELNEKTAEKLMALGLKESLKDKHWHSYVAAIGRGNVLGELIDTEGKEINYEGMVDAVSVKLKSSAYNNGNIGSIMINGKEYAVQSRGLNIVVMDAATGVKLDSVCFDTHVADATCKRIEAVPVVPKAEPVNVAAPAAAAPAPVVPAPAPAPVVPALFDNNNERNLHAAFFVAGMGGSSLDYFVDKGIKKIAIYGTDLLASLLYEQAYAKGIETPVLISDRDRKLDMRLPRVGGVEFKNINNVDIENLDMPIVIASVSYPIELTKRIKNFKERSLKISDLNYYSILKHSILDMALEYQKSHPKMKVVVLNMTRVFELDNISEIERSIKTGQVDRAKILNAVFYDRGFDKAYVDAVTPVQTIVEKYGIAFVADEERGIRRCSNGYRTTLHTPENFENTIYFFGNSVCFGVGTDDEYTIETVLQKSINEYYNGDSPYSVLNCANGGGLNTVAQAKYFNYHAPVDGDIVVFCMGFGTHLEEMYKDKLLWVNTRDVLNRPHDLGEIYYDNDHMNRFGYEACGKLLAKALKENNYLESRETLEAYPKERKRIELPIDLNPDEMKELDKFVESLEQYKDPNATGRIGSIVMNCNPFTLGHRYLIESSAAKCDKLYIFVVEENQSVFPFEDRLELVRKGTADLKNVTVLPSGNFIISQKTFQAYFTKEENNEAVIDASGDINIFASKIAPALGITVRFAGEEPLDNITNQYNSTMKRILPRAGIDFEVIKRKEEGGAVISASRVRKLLKEKNFDEIARITPPTTLEYLRERFRDSKSVLVLGGTRFMGIRLVEKLIEKNHFVTIATRGRSKDSFGKKVTRVVIDRLNEQTMADAFDGKYYDIVIDNTSYCSNAAKYALEHIKCGRYIMISSIAVYSGPKTHREEKDFDASAIQYELLDRSSYNIGKRYAEAVLCQGYPDVNYAIPRIPFVVEEEHLRNKDLNMRLYFYTEHIVKGIPLNIDNPDYTCSFIRTTDEADFIIQLAESDLRGPVNVSAEGTITVAELVKLIERLSGKTAVITPDGDPHPFRQEHFGEGDLGCRFDLEKAKSIGYQPPTLMSWLEPLIQKYIDMINAE
ncbi:MAG: polysaccharide pyruvyl transferase family protein [Oscillospiraceae bacterium]|nr:polysaccharide pyruvyl transferase family protein [Oscillospiraceae bacterium]